jgi:hypothetical protein
MVEDIKVKRSFGPIGGTFKQIHPLPITPEQSDVIPIPLLEVKYDHGFSEEQVYLIKLKKQAIEKRNLTEEPVTLEEMQEVIVPYMRIIRTTAFILNPEKVKKVKEPRVAKTKTPRVAKPKIVKEKKLTQKAIKQRLDDIIYIMFSGTPLSEEDDAFFKEHTRKPTI